MVGWTNRRAQEYPEQWPEKCLEHRTEKCLERIQPEGQKQLEKGPENQPEQWPDNFENFPCSAILGVSYYSIKAASSVPSISLLSSLTF
jgi:hypothetical protein